MLLKSVFACCCLLFSLYIYGQPALLSGKIINRQLDPLAFVSVQVKGQSAGTTSKEDGTYQLNLERGEYDIVFSIIGYRALLVHLIIDKDSIFRNVILEEDTSQGLAEVVIRGRDKAVEIVRHVIANKQSVISAAGAYSCKVYIKAVQKDSSLRTPSPKTKEKEADTVNADLRQMAMTESVVKLDYESPAKTREERIGVSNENKRTGLFYLTTTDGDFNFYNNLLKVPAVSDVPILSPFSYSGLLAYKYRTLAIYNEGNRKIFRIEIQPRQLSNATVSGIVDILDSSWVILKTIFDFPRYHLPEYDGFRVEQDYDVVKDSAWMLSRQQFSYTAKAGKKSISGTTIATYRDYELHRQFDKKYFGVELSATSDSAYHRDSSFWSSSRTEPLTVKEIRFIRYKDSIYDATHSKKYLDSLDKEINKVRLKNVLFNGQTFNDHEKERRWYIPPITSWYQPFMFGGSRIWLSFNYFKTYPSRKNIVMWNAISYGIRNHDVNGRINFSRLYNPFHRSYYRISLEREFQYIFQGDAWINMIKRSNIYLNNSIGVGHNFEILNGLYLFTDANIALRRSVSDYETNPQVDSLLGDILKDNEAVYFKPYNAFYGQVRIEYTPRQPYIREPKEKIILGSKWPTFYTQWRKGFSGILSSEVNFDYIETGITQEIKMGLLGTSNYTVRTGTFLNQKDLRLVDYKFQRRGDPLLFLNPNEAFQALDSTFPVFKRFYEGHIVHDFNGAIINKVPLLRHLRLREVAGAGFLVAPERDLRYGELFTGIERIFKWPFNPLTKFKLGVYVVGSMANQFRNPVQFKIGVTTWDKVKNKWF